MKIRKIIVLSMLINSFSIMADDNLFSPKGIAEIHITLLDGKKIEDIKRDETNLIAEKLSATMVIKNSSSSSYSESELYNGKIEIKGRGNTTWGLPKKPYAIDLVTALNEDNPSSLLGMPADEEWVLLAFWRDRSLMRNPLAYYLGSQMTGLEYSPRFRYVEIFINGDYRGLYMLCEKIKRAKERVNISKLTTDDPNLISGGYILEVTPIDRVKIDEVSAMFKSTKRAINFVVKYPKPSNVTPTQVLWIKNYMDEFETVLYGESFKDTVNGYLKYINENSFIDWYILYDLSKGVDNLFHASLFFHKDRNGKLNMSAPWDFDISFGNVNSDCYYEDELWIKKTHYFNRLMQDERFARKLIARYDELMLVFDKIPNVLTANFKQLEINGCINRDHTKWPQILGDYKDKELRITPTTVSGHVRWFKEWLESRKIWLYINYGFTESDRCERLKNSKPIIRIMNPETFAAGGSSEAKIMRGYTYVWNNSIVTTNSNYQINNDGNFWAQIQDTHGCISLSSNVIDRGEPKEEGTDLITISNDINFRCSNPVKKIQFVSFNSYKNDILRVELFNMTGTLVNKFQYIVVEGQNDYRLDMAMLPAGLYLAKYVIGSDMFSEKIIIAK